ncbi:MAG: ABC transporter ATP-binding protein [Terriglobia bacterium]
MSFLELHHLTCRFGDKVALSDFSLSVQQGEVMSLLGPSGCGKTTTLRLIAGFLFPSSGKILVDRQDITSLPPERRSMGMVFQSYALFPHMNVFENVAFGLRAAHRPSEEIAEKVRKALARVQLSNREDRPVFELSGGEQQRVALARALVLEPRILLLDEPLSNLDASLREHTRKQLRELISSLKITTVFVTHDQEDAFALSDRIAVLSNGAAQQVGTAPELYDRPTNEFVARFIGKSNILSLRLRARNEQGLVFELPRGAELHVPIRTDQPLEIGRNYSLLLRPERIEFSPSPANTLLFQASLKSQRFAGAYYEWELDTEGGMILAIGSVSLLNSFTGPGARTPMYASPLAFHLITG